MERLTIISSDGEVCRTRRDISDGDAWHKLAEYEDTGLTPKEIKELKADRDYWKAESLKHCAKLGEIKLLVGRSNA